MINDDRGADFVAVVDQYYTDMKRLCEDRDHWQAEAERLQNESLRRLALAREWQNKYDVAVEQKILAYEDYVKISHELSTATALAEKYKGQRDEIIEAAESLVRTCKSFQSNIRTRDVENAITRIQDQDKENGL